MKAAINDLPGVTPQTADYIRGLLWLWVNQNGHREVRLSFWIIRKTFKISDLHAVFELLLGPNPYPRT